MKYYVNIAAEAGGDGSEARPFVRLQQAADIALPGDEVLVAPGIYREAVDPKNGGTETDRIVYCSVEKLGAVITGAEAVKGWERIDHAPEGMKKGSGTVWRVRLSNREWFADYNPYTTMVSGDWFAACNTAPDGTRTPNVCHTGEVYLQDKALFETAALEGVFDPKPYRPAWDIDFSVYTWYTEQDEAEDSTVIYANFHDFDPNKECVEINVRPFCFYPREEGRGYITLSGFKVTKAATQWAPPTAYQEGMIGPHWSKGWIIEDCEVSHAKCSGISLGKYLQPENDNKWLKEKVKDGTQTERDCICRAQREGWTKERIGSHIIRRCHIHDCGQTGIVGHLGGVFSVIEDNHIHHINVRQNLAGAEIGGIKMHAAIDVIYRNNHIHHCSRGIWLDWQAQGTRVTGNLMHDNSLPYDHLMCREGKRTLGEDLFIEVSHGPTLVDNNILLSDRAMKLCTQGVAVVHNLIAGAFTAVGTGTDNGTKMRNSARYTPYHVPHRTEIDGFMTILHGDMRFYNNIFVQKPIRPFLQELMEQSAKGDRLWDDNNIIVGTHPYNGYMDEKTWLEQFEGYCGHGSGVKECYYAPLPVWCAGNVYYNGAKPCELEQDAIVEERQVRLTLEKREEGWILDTDIYAALPKQKPRMVSTHTLGRAFEPEECFENPDGTPITFDTDYYGEMRTEGFPAGPFNLYDGKRPVAT